MSELEFTSTNEPSLAKLRLRTEVTFSLRSFDGRPSVLVNNPTRSQFFRLGLRDWQIAKLFDGKRTLRQVIAEAKSLLGEDQATPTTVFRLASWLVQSDLAEVVEGSLAAPKPRQEDQSKPTTNLFKPLQKLAQLGAWNPLFMKFSLPNPQPILRVVYPFTAWIFTTPFFLLWLSAVCFATYSLGSQWPRFQSSFNEVFSPDQWLHLLLVWLVLKILHEIGHAICCMKYGGSVTRWGLMFIVFSPIAWVDVTSAWAFRSKWKRIAVSVAGMYVEFFLAAVAAIIWANTDSPQVATISRNIVISASVTTLMFNLNFLMRFDGYFVLTDLLDVENLYGNGQKYLQYFQRRHLLGMKSTPPKTMGWKLHFIRAYAFAAMIWRLVFYVGLVIVASHLFHGAGLFLGIFSGVLWFGLPLARIIVTLMTGSQSNDPPQKLRFAGVCLVAVLLIVGALFMPWPGRTKAWGYVEYAPLQDLRVDKPGFVRAIHVAPGDDVEAGQPLLTLENPELTRDLADLDVQLQIQEIQRRMTHRDDDFATYAAVGKKVESLREQRDQLAAQIESLTVRAPISGTVIAYDLDSMLGKFLTSGTDLLAVGSTGEKEVRISITQEQVETFRASSDRPVEINIKGHSLSDAVAAFSHVNPKASQQVLHPALSATLGGPLAVQGAQTKDGGLALIEPHFEGVVKVPSELSDELHAGEICTVSLGRGHCRVYEKLWTLGRAYFERKSQT